MMNRIAAQGIYAIMFAASVEMLRQTVGADTPRGSTALIITLRHMVIDTLKDWDR